MIKHWLNLIRYNYYFSRILLLFFLPFYRLAIWLIKQIQNKIKLNGVVVYYDGIKVKFPRNVGVGFSSAIYWKGDKGFEPYTWKVIRELSRNSNLFVDIGSNFGFYSHLVHQVNPEINSICFEPVEKIYRDNLSFHNVNNVKNFKVLNCACSDSSGIDIIYLPKHTIINEVRSASLESNFFYNQQFGQIQLEIKKIVFDEYVTENITEFKNKNCFLKIDVEGHEYAVLKGCTNFINTYKPLIVCEIDKVKDNVERIMKFMSEFDYQTFAITPAGIFKINGKEILAYSGGRDFLLMPKNFNDNHYFGWEELKLLY